jgi:DNA-binding XRE family transcriptional regulator
MGRIPKVNGMAHDIPRIRKVRPANGRTLRVLFAGERRARDVDLTGLFARSRHFLPLSQDAEAFSKIKVVENGIGVAWPVKTKWGRLDLSSSTLRRIAEEQQPMSGTEFSQWRTKLGLSLSEAAKLLGVGRRTIMSYLKKDELPAVVAIACRALARDKHLLAAHYVPVKRTARHVA